MDTDQKFKCQRLPLAEYAHQPMKDFQRSVSDFTILRVLGEGGFGKVHLAAQKSTHTLVALKKIFIKRNLETLLREMRIQAQLRHPNVIKFYDVFSDGSYLYLTLEYAPGGSLRNMLDKRYRLSENEAAALVKNIVSGLKYIHQRQIIHRDLKPENLLIDKYGQIKIADFGLSVKIERDEKRATYCGTQSFLAPEIILCKPYTFSVDLWSLGVIIFKLIVGKLPFHNNYAIVKLAYSVPDSVSDSAKELIGNLLKLKPTERLSIANIEIHSWIPKYETIIID